MLTKQFLFFSFIFSLNIGCAATLVSTPEENTHVLGYKTGSMGKEWYDSKFMAKAREICGEKYEIIEKSAQPNILKSAGNLKDKYHYYWVIKCLNDQPRGI